MHIQLTLSFLVLGLAASSLAMVPCLPDACKNVKCGEVVANCRDEQTMTETRHRLLPHGTHCGCCSLCIKILSENDPCYDAMLQGHIQNEYCEDGLKCDYVQHKCVKA